MSECFVGGFSGGSSVGCGVYTGNGKPSQIIDLGVAPKWVLVADKGNIGHDDNSTYGGLALVEYPGYGGGKNISVQVYGNGFRVFFESGSISSPKTNEIGVLYYYLYGI